MAKPRLHEIAFELGADSNVLLALLRLDGETLRAPSNTVEVPVARRLRKLWERDGARYMRERSSPAVEALQQVEWSPHAMPAIVDQTTEALLRLTPNARTTRLLRAAREGRRFTYVSDPLPDTSGGAPLPPPPSGVAYFAQTQQVLAWADEWSVLVSWNALANAEPNARMRRVGALGTDAPDRLHALAALRTPDLGTPRSSARVPLNPEPGAARPDVVLVYRTVEGGTHASPSSRRAADYRWEVRGHHRRQWYPRTGEHKVIWIGDHTAGARNVPLVHVERVEVF